MACEGRRVVSALTPYLPSGQKWYLPSPCVCPRAKAQGQIRGEGRYHSPALTSRVITCLLHSLIICVIRIELFLLYLHQQRILCLPEPSRKGFPASISASRTNDLSASDPNTESAIFFFFFKRNILRKFFFKRNILRK